MRKLLLLALLLCPMILWGQSFETFYKTYGNKKGVESKKIGKLMLRTAALASDDVPDGLEGIMAISVADVTKIEGGVQSQMAKDMSAIVASPAYKQIFEKVDKKGMLVKLYSKPSAPTGKVKDLITCVSGNGKLSYILMKGEVDEETLELPKK